MRCSEDPSSIRTLIASSTLLHIESEPCSSKQNISSCLFSSQHELCLSAQSFRFRRVRTLGTTSEHVVQARGRSRWVIEQERTPRTAAGARETPQRHIRRRQSHFLESYPTTALSFVTSAQHKKSNHPAPADSSFLGFPSYKRTPPSVTRDLTFFYWENSHSPKNNRKDGQSSENHNHHLR